MTRCGSCWGTQTQGPASPRDARVYQPRQREDQCASLNESPSAMTDQQPVELDPVEYYVLDVGLDDWYGLYELLFDADNLPSELWNAEDRRKLLVPALRRLLHLGLAEIGVRPNPFADAKLVPASEAERLVEDIASWADSQPDQPEVVFGTTDVGRQIFMRPGDR